MASVYDRYEAIAKKRDKDRKEAPKGGGRAQGAPRSPGRTSAGKKATTPDVAEMTAKVMREVREKRQAKTPITGPNSLIAQIPQMVAAVSAAARPKPVSFKGGTVGTADGGAGFNGARGGLAPVQDAYAAFDQWVAGLPAIDRNAYVAPFEQAEGKAREAADAAKPVITGAFGDLRGRLGGMLDQRQTDAAGIKEALAATLARNAQGVQGLIQPSLDGLAASGVDPRIAGDASAQVNTLAADQADSDNRALGLYDMISRIGKESMEGQIQSTETTEQAALADTQNNLTSILNQLGLRKADAERQYQGDVQNRELEVQGARNEYEKDLRTSEREAAEQAAELQLQEREMRVKEEKNLPSRADNFRSVEYPALVAKYPKATELFDDLVGSVKGSGPMAKAQALRNIRNVEGLLKKGKILDNKGQEVDLGFTPDIKMLTDWIDAYYDEDTKVAPRSPGRI